MIKEVQYIILRSIVRLNPKTLYLFGDNILRRGLGGQAKEMRDEPNTSGIITKLYPDNRITSFMHDSQLDKNKTLIERDINLAIEKYKSGGYENLVIPPMGVGLAKLPEKAPLTYKFLRQEIERLKMTLS